MNKLRWDYSIMTTETLAIREAIRIVIEMNLANILWKMTLKLQYQLWARLWRQRRYLIYVEDIRAISRNIKNIRFPYCNKTTMALIME